MLYLDPRVGSIELLPRFKPYDIQVDVNRLDFGDMAWTGNGPDSTVYVGAELKNIYDLIASMRSKRLSGFQLPGLLKTYDWVYLIVQGITRAGKSGAVEILQRKDWVPLKIGSSTILFREVDHYLSTLQHVCGLTVKETDNEEQTAAFVVSRFQWWQKPWTQHDSFREIYAPTDIMEVRKRGSFHVHQPTFAEKIAVQLPGVGKGAFSIAKRFKSALDIANAGVDELAGVKIEVNGKEGKGFKRLGEKRAEVIYEIWRRRE